MVRTTRSTIGFIAACAALRCPAEAARHDGVSDSLLGVNSSADETGGSWSGKNIFDEFFADPASFSEPRPVDGDASCGMWCSTMGGGSKVGLWSFNFGDREGSADRMFGHLKDVYVYSFHGGKDLVVQWAAGKRVDASWLLPILGGWAYAQLQVKADGGGAGLGEDHGAGPYRTSPGLGMGNTDREVYDKMCPDDGTTQKYAFPLHWDSVREMQWLGYPADVLVEHFYFKGRGAETELLHEDDVVTKDGQMQDIHNGNPLSGWTKITEENVDTVKAGLFGQVNLQNTKESVAKMEGLRHGLLVLQYSCKLPIFDPLKEKIGEFQLEQIVIYLTP